MGPTTKVLVVAAVAGVLGAVAGLWLNGPGPLLRTEVGQRALQGALNASAPPTPAASTLRVRLARVSNSSMRSSSSSPRRFRAYA